LVPQLDGRRLDFTRKHGLTGRRLKLEELFAHSTLRDTRSARASAGAAVDGVQQLDLRLSLSAHNFFSISSRPTPRATWYSSSPAQYFTHMAGQ